VGHSRDKKYIVLANFEFKQECNVLREVAQIIADNNKLPELLTADLQPFVIKSSEVPTVLNDIRTALRIMDRVTP
jgi:hypothetical protein